MSNGRPIGTNNTVRYPTEGTNANGQDSQTTKNEAPNRVDMVNESLIYLGWAESNSLENESKWKVKRIRKLGAIWELAYANGNEFYRNKWSDRSSLVY